MMECSLLLIVLKDLKSAKYSFNLFTLLLSFNFWYRYVIYSIVFVFSPTQSHVIT
jgi:hypothetical protein